MGLSKHKLTQICKTFNQEPAKQFGNRFAHKRFLSPLGLSLETKPDPSFGMNQNVFSYPEEVTHFKALHFVKYRLRRELNKNPRYITKDLWQCYRLWLSIRNRISVANLPLVRRCIGLTSIHYDYDSLLSEGYLTILDCVNKFDPWRGYRFSTYACNSMFRRFGRVIPQRKIQIDTSRDPDEVRVEDKNDGVSLHAERVRKLLDSSLLKDRELDIISSRFGFNGGQAQTLEKVGIEQKITKERVRQIQASALKKIKLALDKDPLLK